MTEPADQTPTPPPAPASEPPTAPKAVQLKLLSSVKARMLAGLITILPLLLTIIIVSYIFSGVNWLMGPLSSWMTKTWFHGQTDNLLQQYPGLISYPLSFLLAGFLLYAVGVLADTRLRMLFDEVIHKVPVVKKIYSAIEGIVRSLAGGTEKQKGMFERVCFFSLYEGVQQVGFLTGHTRDTVTGQLLLCIYVPTPPNPTSGLIFMVPPERVHLVNWTAEQSVQTIVSGGALMPHTVAFQPASIMETESAKTMPAKGPAGPPRRD